MAQILTRRSFKGWRQPASLGGVAQNRLTDGLVFLAAPGITGNKSTWNGGPGPVASLPFSARPQVAPADLRFVGWSDITTKQQAIAEGLAFAGSGITGAALNWTNTSPWTDNRNAYSLMWFGKHNASGTVYAFQVGDEGVNGSGGNFDQRDIQLNSASGGTIGLIDYHGGYNLNVVTTGATWIDGKTHCIIAVRNGSSAAIYVDGVSAPLTVTTATTTSFAPSPGVAFGSINSKTAPDFSLAGAAWNYPITQDIAEEVCAHPWSLWQRGGRNIFAVGFAGAATPFPPELYAPSDQRSNVLLRM